MLSGGTDHLALQFQFFAELHAPWLIGNKAIRAVLQQKPLLMRGREKATQAITRFQQPHIQWQRLRKRLPVQAIARG
jgi:hypothetical protein